MENAEVAQKLKELADLLEIQGENSFKIAAYRRAAITIEELGRDLSEVWRAGELRQIPGVGEALEKKLDEMLRTGALGLLERLHGEIPAGVVELLDIPGVGPRTAQLLWQRAGITSVAQAEEAARQGRLRRLPGVSEKTEAKILAGIEALKASGTRL
jgi:DNA polymerase (family X)